MPQREAPPAAESSADDVEQIIELAKFGAVVAFVNTYILTNMQCIGPSMLPTLGESGDNVLMWPTGNELFTIVEPQRGDVVVCASPTDPTSTVCKRICGMPGDIVHFPRRPGMPTDYNGIIVPRGHCFLQGDNERDSTDSRYYGPVPLALIRGIVFAKVWPLREMCWITRERPPPAPSPLSMPVHEPSDGPIRRATGSPDIGGRASVDMRMADEPASTRPAIDDEGVASAWRQKLLRTAEDVAGRPEAPPSSTAAEEEEEEQQQQQQEQQQQQQPLCFSAAARHVSDAMAYKVKLSDV